MNEHGLPGGSSRPGPAPMSDRMTSVLSTIAAHARRTNQVRAAELGAALDRAAAHGLDPAGWAAAERTAHQLAGSAGTFGFRGVSDLARSLERFLADAGATGRADPARLAEARGQLDRVSEQLAVTPS